MSGPGIGGGEAAKGASQQAEIADVLAAREAAKAAEVSIRQDVSAERMQDHLTERGDMMKQEKGKKDRKSLKEQRQRVQRGQESIGKKQQNKVTEKQIDRTADQYAKRNRELDSGKLKQLVRQHIGGNDKSGSILKKMQQLYEDVSLRDEAMEFLEETTEGELLNQVKEARAELNKERGQDINAGRNVGTMARKFAEEGLGSPTALRDLYRDLVANPRDSRQLFAELGSRFKFHELKKVADFIFNSLGNDLRSKGPSVPRGLLHRLITETRSMQAVLGVYGFFKGRMSLIRRLFAEANLAVPKSMNFEKMAKVFMELVQERYPTSDKLMRKAVKLGIEKWIQAKIIAFSQFRDGIREVALYQIFLSVEHRDELLNALLEALEDLEEELEEEENERDDEDDDDEDDESEFDIIEDDEEDEF